MPIVTVKDNKTKAITARAAPSKGVESYAVKTVIKMAERLGHRRAVVRSDSEPAILAPTEAARTEGAMWR